MGLMCQNANACTQTDSQDFFGWVRPEIEAFIRRVMALHFDTTPEAWQRDDSFHAYYNWGSLCGANDLERAWPEYLRWPAPTLGGRRDEPVRTGERSVAMAAPRSGIGIRIPLPGGSVTHYVDHRIKALINATNPMHVLHPGYIVRWLSVRGVMTASNTLGRGIGWTPRVNEYFGVRIFSELDENVRAYLPRR